jgi:myo-inositol catabolism protein IolC
VKWCSTRASYPAARGYNPGMALGYDGKLYILAFDHRGSFQKKMFGIEGDPTEEETERIADAKHLIFEGMLKAVEAGVDPQVTGVLVDEQFGAPKNIPGETKERGLLLAMPVEKSGQNEFDFEYGDDFGAHIESFDPHFSKVLVRFNPEGDAEMNRRQVERLKRLSDWLRERDRKFLFELLVPAEDEQLEKVGGDTERFDAELRPELMIRAIEQLQDAGIEADVWKIEGIDTQEDCERIVQTARRDGRDGVICVVLGRGANDEKVDHWLRQGAPVEGYAGFAIGRTIWWDALKGFLDGDLERDEAAQQISDKYLRFVKVYNEAARETAAA